MWTCEEEYFPCIANFEAFAACNMLGVGNLNYSAGIFEDNLNFFSRTATKPIIKSVDNNM